MTAPLIRILVVDDDADDFFIIQTMLSRLKNEEGRNVYQAEQASTYAEAMTVLSKDEHEVCLLDYRLPGGSTGLDFLKEAKEKGLSIPIIFLTGIGNSSVDTEAMLLGAADFLRKDKIDAEILSRSIRYTLERLKNERTVSQLASIVESSDAAVCLLDTENKILSWNRGAERTCGFTESETLGKEILFLIPEKDRKFFERLLDSARRDQKVVSSEGYYCRKGGDSFDVSLIVAPIRGHASQVSVTARDIVERKRHEEMIQKHEERLRQSEKMEAIGNLAAGVAHDFNNLLNVISGNADLLLLDKSDEETQGREEIEEIQKAVLRGSEMTRQLLLFSRKEVSQLALVSLNPVVEEVGKMLRRMIREDVEIVLQTDPSLRYIKADSLHIQQIIMNLSVNARDAMPEGGKLVIETKNMDLEESFESGRTEIPPGRYVVLSVSDTGTGMDKEVQERIFEPFFTTKEPGKGTGLGLATVYGVVQKYGGHIWVYSEKGFGTTFRVCFRSEAYTESVSAPKEEARSLTGSEMVLVVEDEPSLRRVIVKTLEKNGYQVLEAENGEQGLAKMWESWRDVKLLLTDSVMPKMSGKKLADEVKKLKADMKVLFISGYPRDVLSTQGVLDPDIELLQKPFSGEMLLKRVRDVLEDKKEAKSAERS